MNTGNRLKNLRKAKDMTLQQLSDKTDLSVGYLSNVERNLTSPTVSRLFKICEALGVDLTAFLEPLTMEDPVVRADDRELMFYLNASKVKFESLCRSNAKLTALCVTMLQGTDYGDTPQRHMDQDEFTVVISGKLEMIIEGVSYMLGEGDAIYIKAQSHHHYKNAGDCECVLYSVMG